MALLHRYPVLAFAPQPLYRPALDAISLLGAAYRIKFALFTAYGKTSTHFCGNRRKSPVLAYIAAAPAKQCAPHSFIE